MNTPRNSSRRLIDEAPLLVLPSLATILGLHEAIVLQQIHYWLQTSKHDYDGRKWLYNSYPDWAKQFPFLTVNQIRRAIEHLEDRGLLLVGNYNSKGFDRTKWYSIDYDVLEGLELPATPDDPSGNFASPSGTDARRQGTHARAVGTHAPATGVQAGPIPETNTETNTERETPAHATGDISLIVPPGTPVNKRPDAPRKQPRPLETPCPAEFPVTDEMRTWARTNTPSLVAQLPTLTRLFVSYYTGGKGAGTLAGSWSGMWQTWMLRQVSDYSPPRLSVVAPAGPEPRYVTRRSS